MTRPAVAPAFLALAFAALALPAPARAHHGVAAVSVAGPEGPGAAMETTSPLPLPQGMFFAMAKSEYVPFQRRASADPTNKSYSWFNMAALGYGVRPWMSLYVFQPFNVKAQDGVGRNAGPGDTNLMLSFAFKYDQGFELAPEKESLDDLMDWHFGAWVASTLPFGPTAARTSAAGDEPRPYYAPDMQTGFGAPSATLGVSAMKQLTDDLTWLADASYQYFFPHTYRFTRYQFGGETRLDTAAVYRVLGSGRFRLDVSGELNGLVLQRDQQRNDAGAMQPLSASGGTVLYVAGGLRAYYGPFAVGLGLKRAALTRLNEEANQQGSEGLERFRAAFTVSYATSL
jgi:hypothetical protein